MVCVHCAVSEDLNDLLAPWHTNRTEWLQLRCVKQMMPHLVWHFTPSLCVCENPPALGLVPVIRSLADLTATDDGTTVSAAEPRFSTATPLMFSISCETHAQVYLSCRPPYLALFSPQEKNKALRSSLHAAVKIGPRCSAPNPLLQPHKFIRVHLFDPTREQYMSEDIQSICLWTFFTRDLGVWILSDYSNGAISRKFNSH